MFYVLVASGFGFSSLQLSPKPPEHSTQNIVQIMNFMLSKVFF
jgi:hypothetical protein